MPEDLVNDEQWQDMLLVFRDHFWEQRVPAFEVALEAQLQAPEQVHAQALKLSLHGLAGVAALVGLPDIGDIARHLEQRWDSLGQADLHILDEIQALAQALRLLKPIAS